MIEHKPRTGGRKKRVAPTQPLSALEASIGQYLDWIATHNFSEDTVNTRRAYLGYFHEWCQERGLEAPIEITRPILERYQRWLYHYRKTNGQPLGFRTQHTRLQSIKSFFQWMARQNQLLYNPASEIVLPRMEHRLPKYVLTAQEAEQIIQQPDVKQAEGLRDRAILETFYSTGMRRMELAHLKVYDLDTDRGTVTIRQGKGRKDRVIPIGERALLWIDKYLQESRPQLMTSGADDGTVFLTHMGEPFDRRQLTALVRRHLIESNVGKMGGCHLFRHTVATLMLENGADIRVIQQMLGHVNLTTTELYTRVSINLLRQVYSATHPAAHLRPETSASTAQDAAAEAELFDTEADEGQPAGRNAMIPSMETLHISEGDLAKDVRSILQRVEIGGEVIIERDARPVAVIRAAEPVRRKISECIALMPANSTATIDPDFAKDVEAAIAAHREPLEPPAWD